LEPREVWPAVDFSSQSNFKPLPPSSHRLTSSSIFRRSLLPSPTPFFSLASLSSYVLPPSISLLELRSVSRLPFLPLHSPRYSHQSFTLSLASVNPLDLSSYILAIVLFFRCPPLNCPFSSNSLDRPSCSNLPSIFPLPLTFPLPLVFPQSPSPILQTFLLPPSETHPPSPQLSRLFLPLSSPSPSLTFALRSLLLSVFGSILSLSSFSSCYSFSLPYIIYPLPCLPRYSNPIVFRPLL
jgi:hypothetical protein